MPCTHILRLPTGYLEPAKGVKPLLISTMAGMRTWLFLLLPTLGGLGAGLLVFLLAPEAEGHGTDAMIEAFHHAGGLIRKRVAPVKVLASALTIGSGGSASKEGPIAQVTHLASPAHVGESARGLLQEAQVREAIQRRKVVVIPETMRFGELIKAVTGSPDSYFPVVDDQGKMTDILSINDIREVLFEECLAQVLIAKDVATPTVVRVFWQESLQDAMDKMALMNVNELPVVREEDPDAIIGMIAKRDIISYYYECSCRWR